MFRAFRYPALAMSLTRERAQQLAFPIWISSAPRGSMNAPQGLAAPASGTDIPDFSTLAADPEIAPLLDFEPVVRKVKRPDGWTPELQRELIARIASTGTLQSAVWQMGKHATGAEALYKVPGAETFRQSWDAAIAIGRRRNGLDSSPPFSGPVPGIQRRPPRGAPVEPEPELEMDEDHKWDLMQSIAGKFMQKVAAERQARLAGEIVAADFYLRQITFIEVMFDLTATSLGFDPSEVLSELRRGKHDIREIAGTGFSGWLDASRRIWWAEEGEPERPSHPDVRFLERHRSAEGDYSTATDQHATGATATPARGYTQEQWAQMGHEEQKRARQRQFDQDAEKQRAWEAKARRDYEERRASDASA